jgi:polyisoprenoid-binding protein YceI
MKKVVFFLTALVITTAASAQTWSLDKAHSKVGFSVTHLMVSTVDGAFKTVDAKITSSKEDFSDASFEFTAETASVDTDNDQRDEHLKKADFFDAEKYPTITFKSTSVKKTGKNTFAVKGNLNLHGVTKPIDLTLTLNGTAVHPYTKKTIAGFKATGTIKRADFNFGSGTPSAVVSDEVTITANGEFAKD